MWPFRREPLPVSSVQVLSLRPSDRLVIECGETVSKETAEQIRDHFSWFAEVNPKQILVVTNATVKVLREGEPPPPPVILSSGRAS